MIEEYISKRVEFNFSKQKLVFDVSQELFSSDKVDEGTRKLLNSLRKNGKINYGKILDLGCGYGVLGIFLKKTFQTSNVLCTDRDLLAVEFTKNNASLNDCKIEARGSLDYENISEKFDLIISNFPAKLQIGGLKKFIYDASKHLTKKGQLAIVIVRELDKAFQEIMCNDIKVTYQEEHRGYFIYHMMFKKSMIFEEDPYTREKITYQIGEEEYFMKTAYGLPEFNSPHLVTSLIGELLGGLEGTEKVMIINPHQGHLAISAGHYLNLAELTLFSKDLLALKYSSENFLLNFKKEATIVSDMNFSSVNGGLLIWSIDRSDKKIMQAQFEQIKDNFEKKIIGGKKNIIECLIEKNNLVPIKSFEKNKFKAVEI